MKKYILLFGLMGFAFLAIYFWEKGKSKAKQLSKGLKEKEEPLFKLKL